MREAKIKEIIGEDNWEDFLKWMRGQTVSRYPDGEIDFYEWDVNAYITKLRTGYDRQKDSGAWD
jgi:hypothetical protein